MARVTVECLACGANRSVVQAERRRLEPGECSRCGYVGWAETKSLTETLRRALRDRTLEQRRRVVAW
jgi:Zn ribbon nucleic-acid-binding protein